jgi:hypothetical protein
MALIERYLHAVRGYLPAAQQDDIIAELAEDIRAHAEDRAATLGRPLTEDEEAHLLKQYGRPVLLAGRYRSHQHLIGPALLPFYWMTLQAALGIALTVHVVIAAGLAMAGRPLVEASGVLLRFPFGAAISVFAWVTIVFVVLDATAARVKIADRWDPRRLPAVPRDAARVSRWQLLVELAFGAVFVLWWMAVPHHPFLIFGPASAFLALRPAWGAFSLVVLGSMLATMAGQLLRLLRPEWTALRVGVRLLGAAISVAIAILVFQSGDLVAATGAVPHAAVVAGLVSRALRIAFGVAAVVTVATTAWELRGVVIPAGTRVLG